MSNQLRSTKGLVVAGAAGLAVLLAGMWFGLVSPQRSKAADLDTEIAAVEGKIAQRKLELANPAAQVSIRASDLYRLTKAMPGVTDIAGVMLEVGKIARRNGLDVKGFSPANSVPLTGYTVQPIGLVVEGRYKSVSSFLADVNRLVRVKNKKLDTRGRLYVVDQLDLSEPEGERKFPYLKAAVTLNAFVAGGLPPAADQPVTSTDGQSTGTESTSTSAAGATP
jgi:Tfp pilus assembly protein PilO